MSELQKNVDNISRMAGKSGGGLDTTAETHQELYKTVGVGDFADNVKIPRGGGYHGDGGVLDCDSSILNTLTVPELPTLPLFAPTRSQILSPPARGCTQTVSAEHAIMILIMILQI